MGACLAVTADAATTSRSRARCSYSNEFATAKKKRDAEEASASATPPQRSAKRGRELDLSTELHDDIWLEVLRKLEPKELAAVSMTSQRFRGLGSGAALWLRLFQERWGPPTAVTHQAVVISGGWKALFGAKLSSETSAAPWRAQSVAERDAMVHRMCDAVYRVKATTPEGDVQQAESSASPSLAFPAPSSSIGTPAPVTPSSPPFTYNSGTSVLPVPEVVFLVDGSGSVTTEDFNAMKEFVGCAGTIFLQRHPSARLGIVQFANDVHVERELTPCQCHSSCFRGDGEQAAAAAAAWTDVVTGMSRMNGGTNMAAPMRRAQKMFSEVPENLGGGAVRIVGRGEGEGVRVCLNLLNLERWKKHCRRCPLLRFSPRVLLQYSFPRCTFQVK
mmetsp:Transcript_26838/g.42987  ORF Transcript_26838/g.42987 Transcript_26838/m.42987 type:complete len:389 (+) Transcript_26838:105-1271(+)